MKKAMYAYLCVLIMAALILAGGYLGKALVIIELGISLAYFGTLLLIVVFAGWVMYRLLRLVVR